MTKSEIMKAAHAESRKSVNATCPVYGRLYKSYADCFADQLKSVYGRLAREARTAKTGLVPSFKIIEPQHLWA